VRDSDTIFAVASGAVRAAVCVLRISGPASAALLTALCGRLPAPRRAALRALRGADGEVLDRALVLWLPGPGSYTGEDSAELQLHGGRAVVQAVSAALVSAGARPAEAGEFSRRAFVNGRMDLLEAEGVADLVAAETEAQRRQALRQMEGAHSAVLAGWAERLRKLLAWQEALIDFPDEDLPAEVEAALEASMRDLTGELGAAETDLMAGARVRDGVVVAVTGAPNVGKSSLVNALAGRDVAIVAATPGTTRDALEVRLVLAGVPVTLIDTAGLRETSDPVEAEGVRRALARAEAADLVLEVVDASDPEGVAAVSVGARVRVANKIDLAPAPAGFLGLSVATGVGFDALVGVLTAEVTRLTEASGLAVLSRQRHAAAVGEALQCLRDAGAATLPELRGEELRGAMRALGRITGAVDVEAVLDTVFGAFCIGK
jgi:tRNA modification GTPase